MMVNDYGAIYMMAVFPSMASVIVSISVLWIISWDWNLSLVKWRYGGNSQHPAGTGGKVPHAGPLHSSIPPQDISPGKHPPSM